MPIAALFTETGRADGEMEPGAGGKSSIADRRRRASKDQERARGRLGQTFGGLTRVLHHPDKRDDGNIIAIAPDVGFAKREAPRSAGRA
jgi:hypothetical protein